MAVVTNFSPNKTAQGPGLIWYNVATPASGARMTLTADGRPDPTENPNAKHIGYTKSGASFEVSKSVTKLYADEEPNPIQQTIDESNATITADIMLVDDFDVLQLVTRGIGTRVTGVAGVESITGGISAEATTGIAVIFPTKADPTKFAVFHLYAAQNEGGFATALARKDLSASSVTFTGQPVAGRPATDSTWNRWSQVATT